MRKLVLIFVLAFPISGSSIEPYFRGLIPGVPAVLTSTAAVTSTESVVLSATIPANTLAVGTTYRWAAFGVVTSATAAPVFSIRLGTTGTTADTLVVTCTAATTAINIGDSARGYVTVRTTGAGGTAIGNGEMQSAATARSCPSDATITVDTTVAETLSITVAAGAAATIDIPQAIIEVANP
jgi:hypothetical protein